MATCKFNVGDTLRRIICDNNWADGRKLKVGTICTVVDFDRDGDVIVKVGEEIYKGNDNQYFELVTKANQFKVGERVIVGESNIGNQYIGQVGVIAEVDHNYNYPYCVNGTSYGNRLWCKATGYAPKFKVGDMVIGNHPTKYGVTRKGWIGKVTNVKESSIRVYGQATGCEMGFWVDPKYFDLYVKAKTEEKIEEKIVITHDGKTTTATKYCADGSKVTATARCAPEDEFDFNVGAELAMERLMEKTKPVEWRVVDRKPRVGDYIRLKTDGCYHWNKPGDILKVDVVKHETLVAIYGKNHIRPTDDQDFLWNYTDNEYEVVEKVTPNEPPKYYNGRVVCVDNGYTDLTVGKIYTFVDGCAKNNYGGQITNSPVKDFNDLASRFHVTKFIEIVEDENKPLTIEEIRKMDGQKVWLLSLGATKKPYPNNCYGGWHTVNARINELKDEDGKHCRISDNDTPYGFLAYRQAPRK